jgi:predicted metal-dependent phosphoesterase TrpH
VLAHPGKLSPRSRIEAMIDAGLDGVEAFHTDHDDRDVEMILDIARDRDLLVTGGSDSHGPQPERPVEIGSLDIPDWVGERFLARAPEPWKADQ